MRRPNLISASMSQKRCRMLPVPCVPRLPWLAAPHGAGLELGDAEVTELGGPAGMASRPKKWAGRSSRHGQSPQKVGICRTQLELQAGQGSEWMRCGIDQLLPA